ncbi:hypothetical protein CO024_01925 [Candidatus Gracilibacteria bacterium CG_4_9_14_0_2_um_filter_38_7]|nr:MAG: hypothetical protein CO024_01925 [Candidatus Gracilibacteria bacterium CG_4_9_14_0_2_um_filter_38_7]
MVIYRDGIYHYNTPGEWRLYNDKTEEDNHPHSEQINIESDMIAFTCDYNLIETKKRTDVLQYYFDFLRVHPFADSNLTVISIIHDLECKKYGFETMDLLQIRFEDRKFYLYFLYYYENNKNKMGILDEIIKLIDDFHNKKLSQKVIDEKDKIIIKTTTELFGKKIPLVFDQKDILEFGKKLHPHFEKEGKQYLVRQVMQNIFHPYFLTKSQEVQEKCRGQFEQHMEILTKYVMDEYINNPDGLTIECIRGIHKNIYGGLTKIKVKTTGGEEEYMTPGEFKTKPNGISRLDNPGTYLFCTPPEKVVEELQKLLSSLHEGNENIYKKVIQLFLTFTEIHPFPDDNGKIGMMLADLILIKNDIYPFFMSSFKLANKQRFYEMIQEYSHGSEKDMVPFYAMIAESYASLYEQKGMADFL